MPDCVDVIVAGDGPAGASAARRLAARGVRVWLVSAAEPSPAPPGETLPPHIRAELAQWGNPGGRIAQQALSSYGIAARWGGRERFHSHVFDAAGDGWHVDHRALCRALVDDARDVGVTVLGATSVGGAARTQDGWQVRLRQSGGEREVSCTFLVDATGRSAAVSRGAGARRRRVDALCGVAGVFDGGTIPQTLCVESTPDGWWYVAPVAERRMLACFMSDADIIRAIGAHRPAAWRALLRRTGLPGADQAPVAGVRLQTLPCETSTLEDVGGAGWLAVGDAASVFDPLASAGVMKALRTGRVAADAICETLFDGSEAGLLKYRRASAAEFERFLAARRAQYRLETRWATHEFWRRRLN